MVFVPQPDFGPLITDTSTIPALITHTQAAAGSQPTAHGTLSPDSVDADPTNSAGPLLSQHTQADQVHVSSTVPVDSNAVSEEPVAVCPATDKDRTGRFKVISRVLSKHSNAYTTRNVFSPHRVYVIDRHADL